MRSIFLTVFEVSMSCSLVVAALMLLTPLLNKRYAARWKYWVWRECRGKWSGGAGGASVQHRVWRGIVRHGRAGCESVRCHAV